MGLFNRGKLDINTGLVQCQADPTASLLDVRTPEEYNHRRIPGSRNLPVDEIGRAKFVVPDKSTPVYVYCETGGRSGRAASILKQLGYTAVHDLGGISKYKGRTEGGPR